VGRKESLAGRAASWPLLLLATAVAACVLALPYAVAASFTGLIWLKALFLILYAFLACAAPDASVRSSPSLRSFPLAAVLFSLAGVLAGYYGSLCLWRAMSASFPGLEFPGVSPILGFLLEPGTWKGILLSPEELLDFIKHMCESGLWSWTWGGPDTPRLGFHTATLYMIWEPLFLIWLVFVSIHREARALRSG
jgi:hypothetical protein